MSIYAGTTKANYSIEDGTYPGILFQIIQIGSQRFEKGGKEWYSPQILLGFELPTLTYQNMNGDNVSNIKSGTYFLSMNPSKNGMTGLREIMDGLRQSTEYTEEELEKFDIEAFFGKECNVKLEGVESKGTVYQNITGVTPYDGEEKLEALRVPILVRIADFARLDELELPEWIKDKIMKSQEYQELINKENKNSNVDGDCKISLDDIPF